MHQLHNNCFPFWKTNIFSAVTPVISLFLEMVSCYFKTLNFLVILIFILIIIIFTLTAFFFLFIRWHQRRIIFWDVVGSSSIVTCSSIIVHMFYWLLLGQSDQSHHLQLIWFLLWLFVVKYCSSNQCSISVWEIFSSNLQQSDESLKYFWSSFNNEWWSGLHIYLRIFLIRPLR